MQSGQLLRPLVQAAELALQHRMRFEQGLCNDLKPGMAGDQLLDPSRKGTLGGLADLQSKAPEHATQAVLDIAQLRLQQLARRQHRPRLLRFDRLAVHRPEPAKWAIPRASLRSDFTGIDL